MLKQLIQRLLDSRTTPAEAAHSARSLFSAPQTFSGKTSAGEAWTDNLVTGISPKDGYLNISASTVNRENFGTMLQVTSNEVQLSQVSSTSGQGLNFLLPITKGAQFSVNGIRAKDITVRFFESLGGGYKDIIWRAVLCLSSYSSYYLKHSLNPKRNGSDANLTLRTESHYQPVLQNMYLLRTGLLQFIKMLKTLVPPTMYTLLAGAVQLFQETHYQYQTKGLRIAQLYLLGRGTGWLSTAQERSFGLHRAKAQSLSLVKGGALC